MEDANMCCHRTLSPEWRSHLYLRVAGGLPSGPNESGSALTINALDPSRANNGGSVEAKAGMGPTK